MMIDDKQPPMFCTNCGSALDVGYRFCGACGQAAVASIELEPEAEAPAKSPGGREPDEHATVIDDMSSIVAAARSGSKPAAANVAEPEPVVDRPPPVDHPPVIPQPAPLVPEPVPPPAGTPLRDFPAPAPYAPHPAYAPPVVVAGGTSTNGFAIASLVLGIVWLYWLGSLLALIFGAVAISQIRNSNGRQTGEGMAIAGLVLGIVGLGLLLILVIIGVAVA
jgi:Domain of unknown function (DUF4190)